MSIIECTHIGGCMIELLKALADENRLRLLSILFEAELCVCEIETILEMSQSNTSRHLSKLKNVKVIESYKDAQWVHYKVSDNFKKEHTLLSDYLVEELKKTEVFRKDKIRLTSYQTLNLTCTDIRDDSNRVIRLITKED